MKKRNKNFLINASEIGQYQYCSVSWYLQKCGYEPISPKLQQGTKSHTQLGFIIDDITYKTKAIKVLKNIGFLFLAISIIILFYEVPI